MFIIILQNAPGWLTNKVRTYLEVSFLRTRYSVRVRKNTSVSARLIQNVFVANPVPWRKLEINEEVYIYIYIDIYEYKNIFLKARTGFAGGRKAIEFSAEVDVLRWQTVKEKYVTAKVQGKAGRVKTWGR